MVKLLKRYNRVLEKIYYDIKQPNSFGSVQKLYNKAKQINKKITINDVKIWLKNQKTYTLHKSSVKKFNRGPMVARYIDQWWQSDLADLSLLSKYNKNVKYLLIVIDVLSKYGWVFPLKNKKPESVITGFQKILKSSKRKPMYIYTDAGTEYVNSKFKKLISLHNIQHVIARNTETKAAVAERWIRTLKEKLFKYMTANNSNYYINILDSIVNAYNNSIHSRTKYKPIDVKKSNENLVFKNLYKLKKTNEKQNLRLDEPVRLNKLKKTFEKGYANNWTQEIFLIEKLLNTKPFQRYTVKDKDGEVLEGSFYNKELQSVNN